MNDLLIPEEELKGKDHLIRKLVEGHSQIVANGEDAVYGPAFRFYILFAERSALQELGLSRLNDSEIFYNKYYWFVLFSKLYQLRHGYDAGLEQQVFRLLESAPNGIDWTFVEEIDSRIKKEVARLS